MATRRKKKIRKYKFELTRSAIGGITVVCFCLFLWMFLLGVWTGQSLLMPANPEAFDGDDEYLEILQDQEKKKYTS